MEIVETSIPGCLELRPHIHEDARGLFVKTLQTPLLRERGLDCVFTEEFYSVSRRGVLRGLHLQLPPADYAKLVYCAAGAAFDAVVDLRRGSPAYGRHATFELEERRRVALYVPRGVAHGFYARTDGCVMVYTTTALHSPEHDSGIRWDSAGIPWPDRSPALSERDLALAPFADFDSPFGFR